MTANIINHIVLVLDASSSMHGHTAELVRVADNQIQYLAIRSKELDQETRITVYAFNTPAGAQCLIYDMDVLRVPSIARLYRASGMTPLMEATALALDDLAMTPEKYGEHSFLIYVLTDGMENASRAITARQLSTKIAGLPDHWTLATFVPDQVAVHEAKRFGFPAQNIAVWDATTSTGIAEAGEKIRQTTDTFMQARKKARDAGSTFRGTRNLFALKDVSFTQLATNLDALDPTVYRVFDVNAKSRIDDFVVSVTGRNYKRGTAYYQLSKREIIQPQKQIAIMGKGGVYVGAAARQMLGLPDQHVRVSPNDNPDYDVFVQSTSNNRNLVPDTKLLLLTR